MGLFPNGTLSSKNKGNPKFLDDPNKILDVKLIDTGFVRGLVSPLQKKSQKEIINDLRKNHKHVTIKEVDENTT